MNCSPAGSTVHQISQARILEWVAISSSEDLPDPGIKPASTALAGGFFITEPLGKPQYMFISILQMRKLVTELVRDGVRI